MDIIHIKLTELSQAQLQELRKLAHKAHAYNVIRAIVRLLNDEPKTKLFTPTSWHCH